MRKFVLGDIHGGYRALMECLNSVKFDYQLDTLIFLGDVCDGWSEFIECIEELMKIKNLIFIRGNHDDWVLQYIQGKLTKVTSFTQRVVLTSEGESWSYHGGAITKKRLDENPDKVPMIKKFIESGIKYHIDDNNNLYVHAGFDSTKPMELQSHYVLMWDRNMVLDAINRKHVNKYNKVFIGHTPTTYLGNENQLTPYTLGANIIMMDTSAAYKGPLSMMDVDTGEVYQSKPVHELYPDESGRNR
jgi:serine/threonine protein phosphatase 1